MNNRNLKITLLTTAITLALSACGGGSSSGSGSDRELVELNSANVSLQPLKSSQSSNFATHLKNGIYTSSINQYCNDCALADGSETSTDASAPAPLPGFSQTNTQESGVDEADRIKYDGEYLYIAANPYNDPIIPEGIADHDYIKVKQRLNDASMIDTAQIDLPEGFNSIRGLYLANNALAAVGNPNYWFTDMTIDIWHPIDQKVDLAVFDITQPENPNLQTHIQFDGYLVSSRKIDNSLYLVSTYSPTVDGLNYGASTDEDKQQNYDTIMATDINSLMPKLSVNGASRNLVEPEDCFIPQDATNADGYNSVVTITKVDLTAPDQMQSTCINALTHDIYVSTESLYLLGVDSEQQAVLHRFVLNEQMDYIGAGNVDGHFGWRNASFRLSEHNEHLRVVTTKSDDNGEPLHQLFVLSTEAQDKQLPVVAQLPNEQQPQAIGKPGEDIFAVRYFNDIGYIVTFERIDPLYVLDLADPTQPHITGELEVPGFSSYLHPINENLLLGVGQEVEVNALPNNGGQATMTLPPAPTGAKVALFDVSDKSNPQQLDTLVYDQSYTPVEWDHHALSYLPIGDNQVRFTLPITSWNNHSENWWSPNSSLKLLEVNFAGETAELIEKSHIEATQTPEDHYYIDSNQDRAILHGNDVYYIHGNEVIQSTWQ